MATLTGKQIANTYKQLLQIGSNNSGLEADLQTVTDGAGNNSALQLSQAVVNVNGTFALNGVNITADASALNNITDLTGVTGIVAVNSGTALGRTLVGGDGMTISNANGTAGNPTVALSVTGVTSGAYGPFTTFDVNQFGQVTSAVAVSASVSLPTIRATEFIGERLNLSDKLSVTGAGNIVGIVSLGNDVGVSGDLAVKGAANITGNVSSAGNIRAAHASIGGGTFSGTVSATSFVGDGSGLTNVPSSEGGTVKTIDAGTGIRITIDGSVSSSIPVSGVIAVSANQNFGTVSVSTAFAATGTAIFGTLSATNIDADELLMAGVSAANVTEVAAVSALTKTNLDAITSINTVIGDGSGFVTPSQLATVSAALATSIGTTNSAVTSVNTVVAAVSGLTKTNLDAITSVNTVITNLSATMATSIGNSNTNIAAVSALTSVNKAAITSINTVIGDGTGFVTDSELATVSAALATSIGNSNTNIAAVSVLTSVNAAAITSANTVIAAVSGLTKTNLDAITSVNSVITDLSATMATSINNRTAAITSINTVITDLSATMATSINNRTGAVTSINTVITNLSATMATSINTANTRITSVSDFAVALSATLAASIGNHLPLAGGTLTGTVSGTNFFVSAVAIGTNALLGKELRLEKSAVADVQQLTDATNITVDFNAGQNFTVTLAGNRTLNNPTNCVAGQVGSIFIVQDGTGSRTLAYQSSWDFPAGEAPTLTTDANGRDRLDYIVHTSTDVQAILTKAYS